MFTRRTNPPVSAGSTTATDSFFGRPVRNSIRPPTHSRQEHIDSYLKDRQLSPSTRKVSDDDSTYDTVFQSVAGDTLILRVHWPPASMARPPAMTLAGVEARHDWLDRRMCVTGYAPIQTNESWKDAGILLGAAVHSVIKHLQLHPPHIVQFVDQGLIAIQANKPDASKTNAAAAAARKSGSNHSRVSGSGPPPPSYSSSMVNEVAVDLPTIPTHFSELDSMTREQLEALQKNELEFRAFCNRLPITAEYHQIQKKACTENAALAGAQVAKEGELKALHQQVTVLQAELKQKVAAFQALEKQQDAACKLPDTRKVCRELQKAKKEAFDASERIADEWLESSTDCSISMDDFCESFLEARNVHHQRAAKLELLERQSKR